MAHIRQSRPDYGGSFTVKVLRMFKVFPSLLARGPTESRKQAKGMVDQLRLLKAQRMRGLPEMLEVTSYLSTNKSIVRNVNLHSVV